jgi:hypothetical protein
MNMIILSRTPKPRDCRVIVTESEIKCTVSPTQEVLLTQQNDLIFNQNSLLEQISLKKNLKKLDGDNLLLLEKETLNS